MYWVATWIARSGRYCTAATAAAAAPTTTSANIASRILRIAIRTLDRGVSSSGHTRQDNSKGRVKPAETIGAIAPVQAALLWLPISCTPLHKLRCDKFAVTTPPQCVAPRRPGYGLQR